MCVQGFSLQLVRKFAHSILQCLEVLSQNKIIHCDLKPENILLKQQGRSGIKVISWYYVTLFYVIYLRLLTLDRPAMSIREYTRIYNHDFTAPQKSF